ncbi:hypothetical protein GOBAR_AA05564 [Gossypium barbadense]|uniref:Uncharacterized protein n=1 Tax=Gossypium barbadense TaxID=3634 RepID=A0A2P5YHH7_GOSBA|nr:hypothetical protein GOBAR_AA05564 [Gossypium barbadense]
MLVEHRAQWKARTMVDKGEANLDEINAVKDLDDDKGEESEYRSGRVAKRSGFQKKTNIKAKGKGVVLSNGPRLAPRVLKPINNMMGSSSGTGLKPFDNGAKMGLKDDANPFFGSTCSDYRALDINKRKAVKSTTDEIEGNPTHTTTRYVVGDLKAALSGGNNGYEENS